MSDNAQESQKRLVDQAMADPKIAEAVHAYEAVRPFVPENGVITTAATYAAGTSIQHLPTHNR